MGGRDENDLAQGGELDEDPLAELDEPPRKGPDGRPEPPPEVYDSDNREPATPVPEDSEPDIAALADLDLTDLGNARRFDLRFGDSLRFYTVGRGEWLMWDGRLWVPAKNEQARSCAHATVDHLQDEVVYWKHELANLPEIPDGEPADEKEEKEREQLAKRHEFTKKRIEATQKWLFRSQASGQINAILTQAKGIRGRAVCEDDLDRDRSLLVALNATIDLRTMRARAHDRRDLCTRGLDVAYVPGQPAPLFEQFLRRVQPDAQMRGFIQRVLGYSLLGTGDEQRWFLFTGEGSNGKSTLLDAVRKVIGSYAIVLPAHLLERQRFESHPTELMTLRGARLAVGSEPRKDAQWDSERIKQLTGDEEISARAMFSDFLQLARTWTLIVLANEKPKVDDPGHAFWRRLVVVPWEVVIRGADVDAKLLDKLVAEGSGILNWLLAGLREYTRVGLNIPAGCVDATSDYQLEQDHIRRFVEAECEVAPQFSVPVNALYDAFRKWWTAEGIDGVPPPKTGGFSQRLKALGYKDHRSHTGRVRLGLTLRDRVAEAARKYRSRDAVGDDAGDPTDGVDEN